MKPLLASEVLASERAPLEPGRHASRFQLGVAAIGLLLIGLALRAGVGAETNTDDATVAFCGAGVALALAILPFPYALRAGISALVGAVLLLLGLRGSGPLAGLGVDGGEPLDLVRLVTITLLPAALLLRARYASFNPTRWVLAGALVAAAPFAVLQVMAAAAAETASVTQVAAICAATVVAAGLFALFGDGSLGNRSPVAWLVLLVLPAEVGLRQLTPLADPAPSAWLTYPVAAFGLFLAGLLVSTGTYQLAATVLGPRAQSALKKKLLSGGGTRNPPLNLVKR